MTQEAVCLLPAGRRHRERARRQAAERRQAALGTIAALEAQLGELRRSLGE